MGSMSGWTVRTAVLVVELVTTRSQQSTGSASFVFRLKNIGLRKLVAFKVQQYLT